MKNKKGTVAFEWVYGLVFLFLFGLFFIMLNYALIDNFMPTYENMIPDSSPAKNDVITDMNEWLSYWNILPVVFFFVIATYWLVSSIRKKSVYQPPEY